MIRYRLRYFLRDCIRILSFSTVVSQLVVKSTEDLQGSVWLFDIFLTGRHVHFNLDQGGHHVREITCFIIKK